jgi:hypothetical protein
MLHTKARAVLFAALIIGVSSVAIARSPAAGLGQAWPNTTDVSASPHYHAYRFVQNGVRYIQVNGLDGTVLGAVGTAGGEFIVLPVGNAAQVTTPQQPTSTNADAISPAAEVVYRDASTVITATPQTDGTTALTATNASTALACGDPVVCNSHGAAQIPAQ